jgi:hypothetical protein
VGVAVSSYAASATLAAGDRAASSVQRVVICKTSAPDVHAVVQIYTSGTGVTISTGNPSNPAALLTVSNQQKQYILSRACQDSVKLSPLGPGGFSSTHAPTVNCSGPAHIILRLLLRLDNAGLPVSAKIEVTQVRSNFKPLAFVDWAVGHPTVYYRPVTCTTHR